MPYTKLFIKTEKRVKMMKYLLSLSVLVAGVAVAQTDDDSEVILPLEAQTCNLPAAPAKIPEDADYAALGKAKGNVVEFQSVMETYRECLDSAKGSPGLTDGNEMALVNAHNYSVEMEERVAEQFNAAVRTYKARQAQE